MLDKHEELTLPIWQRIVNAVETALDSGKDPVTISAAAGVKKGAADGWETNTSTGARRFLITIGSHEVDAWF